MDAGSQEIALIREHLTRYRGVTLQTLEMVPEESLGWRPSDGLRTIAEQLLHIAQVESYYAHGFFEGDYDFSRLAPVTEGLTRERLKQQLDESHAYTDGKLMELDPDKLYQILEVPNIPVPWTLAGWLWYVVEHEVHHKAQLALYLRQINVTPPFFAHVFPPGIRPDIR